MISAERRKPREAQAGEGGGGRGPRVAQAGGAGGAVVPVVPVGGGTLGGFVSLGATAESAAVGHG